MQQIESVITDIRPESTNKHGEVDVYRQGYLFNWTNPVVARHDPKAWHFHFGRAGMTSEMPPIADIERTPREVRVVALERDDFSSNRHPALTYSWSMIFFRKPVPAFRDHALGC
jgi:hypothetical protein